MSSCPVVRDAMAAAFSGRCASPSPPPECNAFGLASQKDLKFQTQYSPAWLLTPDRRQTRAAMLAALQTGIKTKEAALAAKYGGASPTWASFPLCYWNQNRLPGGSFGNARITRADLQVQAGYQPQPLVGLSAGWVPQKAVERVPLWSDKIVRPEVAVIAVVVIVLAVLVALLRAAYVASKKKWAEARRDETRELLGSRYPDQLGKARAFIEMQEARGVPMGQYRELYGLEPQS